MAHTESLEFLYVTSEACIFVICACYMLIIWSKTMKDLCMEHDKAEIF